jgi:hypothetical protein
MPTRWLVYPSGSEPLDFYATQGEAESAAAALALEDRGTTFLIDKAELDTEVTLNTAETTVITSGIWGGLTHHWKCDETTDNVARVDSIGSDDFAINGTTLDITDGTGVHNASVVTPGIGGDRFMDAVISVGDDITLAFWGYVPAGGIQFFLNQTGGVDWPRIQITTTFLQAGLYDPSTRVQFDTGAVTFGEPQTDGDYWMLWIIRMDNANRTAKCRVYGIHEQNGVDFDFDTAGPWLNSYTTLEWDIGRNGGTVKDTETDEWMVWDRQITDDECDALGAGAFPD